MRFSPQKRYCKLYFPLGEKKRKLKKIINENNKNNGKKCTCIKIREIEVSEIITTFVSTLTKTRDKICPPHFNSVSSAGSTSETFPSRISAHQPFDINRRQNDQQTEIHK